MYTYTPDRKSKIEKVIKAFEPYILQSDFFDILWSNKFGYLLVKSIGPKMDEMMCLHISSDADLCERLLADIAFDIFILNESDHFLDDASPLELRVIQETWERYLQFIPEYKYICTKMLQKGYRYSGISESD